MFERKKFVWPFATKSLTNCMSICLCSPFSGPPISSESVLSAHLCFYGPSYFCCSCILTASVPFCSFRCTAVFLLWPFCICFHPILVADSLSLHTPWGEHHHFQALGHPRLNINTPADNQSPGDPPNVWKCFLKSLRGRISDSCANMSRTQYGYTHTYSQPTAMHIYIHDRARARARTHTHSAKSAYHHSITHHMFLPL